MDADKRSAFPGTFATLVLLCLPSLALSVLTVRAWINPGTAQGIPSLWVSLIVGIHVITFPWAYLLALWPATILIRRASKTIRTLTWVIFGAASILNLMFWSDYLRGF